MITKKLKHLLISSMLLMLNTVCLANPADACQVILHKRTTPPINSILKPSKAPSFSQCPVNVYWDEENKQIIFINQDCLQTDYSIYDANNHLILEESFSVNQHSAHVESLDTGTYTILVECEGIIYEGFISIN